ncbi:hypothetical protein MKY48_08580 [Paenibacillus sp. FSL W8-0187]|uniref:hypothetical protein n=1 Tax=Paenibacillus sp. FSL W8-0187 TaxID=2921710 RepID=UPI0030DB4C78
MAQYGVDFGNQIISELEFRAHILNFKKKTIYFRSLVRSYNSDDSGNEEYVIYTKFQATDNISIDDDYIRIYGAGRDRIIVGFNDESSIQYEATPKGVKLIKYNDKLVQEYYFEMEESS